MFSSSLTNGELKSEKQIEIYFQIILIDDRSFSILFSKNALHHYGESWPRNVREEA